MTTRKMEETFEQLKCYCIAKMPEQEENLTKVFNNVSNDIRKEITKQIQNEIKSHCKHFESENQMLKHQVSELRRLNISNQNNHEEFFSTKKITTRYYSLEKTQTQLIQLFISTVYR